MLEYALITLNMIEYAGIHLKKQSTGYARILNVSLAVHSIRSLYKLQSSYRDRDVFRTLSNMAYFSKRSLSAGAQSEIFQGKRDVGLWYQVGHLSKDFV